MDFLRAWASLSLASELRLAVGAVESASPLAIFFIRLNCSAWRRHQRHILEPAAVSYQETRREVIAPIQHHIVPAIHTFLMNHPAVIRGAVSFLSRAPDR